MEPAGVEGSITHRGFAMWLLGAVLVALIAIGAANWYVDPTGVTGRATPWRIADNAAVRSEKLDLYEGLEEEPEVVLLGSSRVMKFEPAYVERLTSDRAFNAAVSGGVPQDALLFTKLLEERQRTNFPHLVWGLDIDAFRNKQLRAGLATDPRMRRFIPRGERLASATAAAGTLTELQTAQAALRALQEKGLDPAAREKPNSAEADRTFSPDGFQEWSLPFPKQPVFLARAVRKQIGQYAGFIFQRDAYTRVERAPFADFRRVIEIANRHGDEPTIFLTPYHPLAERFLARHRNEEREQEVRERLHQLQEEGTVRFELVDLTSLDRFGGDPAEFYDGVHMTPMNTRLVLDRLDRDALLAREEVE